MLEVISVLLLIVVVFIILFWMKKTLFIFGFFFKIFMFAVLIIIALSLLTGYLIVKDVEDFSSNFGNSTSMYILKDSVNGTEKFLTGVTINPQNKSFYTMNGTELSNAEKLYKSGIINTIGKNYYKIFIIDFRSFDDMNIEGVYDKNINLSKDELRLVLTSDDAREELAGIVANKTGANKNAVLKELSYSSEEVKSYIFSYYLSTTFNPDNMAKFLAQFQNDNVSVYPETALFKVIRFVPKILMDPLVKKAQQEAYSKIEGMV